jgi:hypothetical protein
MFSQLRSQTPIIAVSPIKMMRYLISDNHTIDVYSEDFNSDDINDLKDQAFSTLKGKMIFNVNKVVDRDFLDIKINRFSLRDADNGIYIHEMGALTGQLKEDTNSLVLSGDAFVNINGAKYICRTAVKIEHSHGSFYEVEYCFQTDDKSKVIYGITLLRKEFYDSPYASAFAAVA